MKDLMTFADLGLEPKILKALSDSGYETPTPIQEQAIPEALKGHDVLGIAQTGTGKTASFTLPMIQRLAKGRAKARMPRSLVLAPTRELAAQVAENFEKYGQHYKLSMALLIGGVSFGDQDAKLTRGVDVLVATPGRLLDHFERGRLLLTGIEVMVVDEADRMLDMGFIPDIERIFKLTPITRQTLFFSATMPPEITRITNMFLTNAVRIEASAPATTATTITQKIVRLPSKGDTAKRAVLRKLLDMDGVKNGIIFCNRKTTVDIVAKSLQKHGYNARPLHGDLAQAFRTETLDKFRNDEIQFLVASDVAARGLDIPDVSHVFNYDAPIHSDDYVHRIGRTGRAGREGAAFMILTPSDEKYYEAILSTISTDKIEELDLGDGIDDALSEASEKDQRRGVRKRSDTRGGRPRNRRARSGSGRSGDSDEKSQSRQKKKPSPKQEESADSIDTSADSSPANSRKEKPSSRKSEKAGEARARRRPGNDSGDAGRRKKSDDKEKVVGLGDHMPAFLER